MNYAEIKYCDVANGPGVRTSLFVSGCTHHCKGCFNEVAWDFNYGQPFTQETINTIVDSLKPDYIAGLKQSLQQCLNPLTNKDTLTPVPFAVSIFFISAIFIFASLFVC